MEGRKPGERVICPGCYRTTTVVLVEGPRGKEFRLVPNEQIKKQIAALPPISAPPKVPGPVAKSNSGAAHIRKDSTTKPNPQSEAAPAARNGDAAAEDTVETPATDQFNIKNGLVTLLVCLSLIIGGVGAGAVIWTLKHKPPTETAKSDEPPIANDKDIKQAVPVELSDVELVRKTDGAVCLIKTPIATGTGFIVGPKLVATNEHVIGIADLNDVKIIFPSHHNSSYEKPKLAFAVWKTDLILLHVPDLPAEYPILQVAQMADLTKFETLTVLGFPLGLNKESVATQVKYGSKQSINDVELLQLSGSVNPGNSGGPALTRRGHVAGIVTLKNRGEGLGLAIPCDTLAAALNDMKTLRPDDLERKVADWRAKQLASKLFEGCRLCNFLLTRDPFKSLPPSTKGRFLEGYDKLYGLDVGARLQDLRRANLDPGDRQALERMDSFYQELSEQTRQQRPNDVRLKEVIGQINILTDRFTKRLGLMDYVNAEDFLKAALDANRP